MDSSHVALCALLMRAEAFDHFRCDVPMALGLHTPNLSKILKCAGNEDIITLKSTEKADVLTLVFESNRQDRISDFDMKLMEIDSEHLGIPDTEYSCTVRLPSSEFQRIMRDLSNLGDTCMYFDSSYLLYLIYH
jgi:proliferating cell nuclear antigen